MPPETALPQRHGLPRRAEFAAALALVLALLFRRQLWTGFGFLFGDRNDAVIEAALLEHWFNVLRGISRWNDVFFFAPYRDGLGYNDGYVLYGLIYAPLRAFGIDPLLASELVNATVKAIGFAAFYAAGRRALALSHEWALFGAALFSLSYGSFVQAGHAQLLSIAFVPVMALLLWHAVAALRRHDGPGVMLWGGLAGLFYGAWLLTSFYTAWFFAFFLLFLMVIALAESTRWRALLSAARAVAIPLLLAGLCSAVALVPALLLYLPKAHETGMRNWAEAAAFTMPPGNVLDFGRGNYLFGGVFAHAVMLLCPRCSVANSEFTTGFPPVLFMLFVAACLRWRRAERQPLAIALAVAAVLSWLFCLRIAGLTPWHLVYDWLPGAKALRVVSRYQLVLAAPVVATATVFLAGRARTMARIPVLLLCTLLIAEELGTGPVGLNRAQELARVAVPPPPAACRVFFVTAASDQTTATGHFRNLLPHNADAMLIAEMQHVATVNGFASFNPPDWNFGDPGAADYTARVMRYAAQHGLKDPCRLDLPRRRWESVAGSTRWQR